MYRNNQLKWFIETLWLLYWNKKGYGDKRQMGKQLEGDCGYLRRDADGLEQELAGGCDVTHEE